MSIWALLVVVAVGLLVFKFIVKPLFKVAALVALVLLAWWFLGSGF